VFWIVDIAHRFASAFSPTLLGACESLGRSFLDMRLLCAARQCERFDSAKRSMQSFYRFA
jgi:hypothetical protein